MFVLWVVELRTEDIKIHMDKKDRTKERKERTQKNRSEGMDI
jgi:hypothetical protein